MDNKIDEILNLHKENSNKHSLMSVKYRIELLKKLKSTIKEFEQDVYNALYLDLNKSKEESYMTEIGIVYSEISYMIKHIKKFSKIKKAHTPLANFPAKSYVVPCPYGTVLVISPWNYPFMLSIEPIVDAIASGNNVILKPSEYSENTSKVLNEIISKTFKKGVVDVILGDKETCSYLLENEFDYIFYTGSTRVGKIVMQKAAEYFTPVTLEMGGKSPCFVDETANIRLAAKRIVFGKFLNAGQTCVAPDFIICHKSIKNKLVKELENEIIRQYSVDPIKNKNYPKMINLKQYEAMKCFINDNNLVFGGKVDNNMLKIEPTILNATFDDDVMQEEIFGPILPIIEYDNFDEAMDNLKKLTRPLAFYFFSTSKSRQKYVESNYDFGGGCINDTIMHIATNSLPFGGIKESGIGSYHGKYGFDTFTHYKGMVKKPNMLDLPFRYQPFKKFKTFFVKLFLR